MSGAQYGEIRKALEKKKQELTARLERIHANLRRGYEADSKEMASSSTRCSARAISTALRRRLCLP